MNDNDLVANYRMKRLFKKIKVKEVAEYLNVSSALVCRHEKGLSMGKDNIKMYQHFIDNYEAINKITEKR